MYPMIPPDRPAEEKPGDKQAEQHDDQPQLARIAGFSTEERAHLAKNFLEAHGIRAIVTTDSEGGAGIALELHGSQARKASRLLKGKIR